MARKVESRYILFTGENHEIVKFDFTQHQIETFITLWNEGYPINKIAERLNTSKVSATLIVMDLEMTGKIGPRDGGLLGKQREVS
ncbi:helix-turn-helix domain-containing protein [Lysinibacillus fusiformis]|uniref:helix-turn-helix domain-containing protein n=1 Tax=Lysinibacillus fusiformis TaxID=28031 RepID=UPI00263BB92C|nr:helix-turn-helix domain-containing protein [Lysinibacillus fusiformis]MDC6268032.1 helix-turn-helix domain-containing protein [Lysinibacillus sphaericus]MDN4967478.1 helix-turn-helix domain-containing protein [Lysinibacillus fusiformis]